MSISRRDFVTGIGAAWIAAAIACREQADPSMASHAPPPDAPSPPRELQFLTSEEFTEIEAIAARIIPTDDTPGAKEAGVTWFIDRALATFAEDQKPFVRQSLKDWARDVARAHRGKDRFSALTAEEQDAFLRTHDQAPFFGFVRFGTIAGMFALPKYGGNTNWIGWELVGQEVKWEQKPPFGWYDDPVNQRALLGRVL